MTLRRTTKKRRPTRTSAAGIDVGRIARNAIELIDRSLSLLDHPTSKGIPTAELEELQKVFPLPPSYSTTVATLLFTGPAGELLRPSAIRTTRSALEDRGLDTARYFPFAAGEDRTFCFDVHLRGDKDELGIVAVHGSSTEFVAANFGEWLYDVAAELESFVQLSADVPARLKRLLIDLGFSFEHPIRAILETADTEALVALLGRRFEQSKFSPYTTAKVTLHIATMRIECSIGDRSFRLPTEETFRWLRSFRDEDFFGGSGPAAPADRARDLRISAKTSIRKPVESKPSRLSRRHVFAGVVATTNGLHVLGHPLTDGPSVILRGDLETLSEKTILPGKARAIAASQDGALWVLLDDDLLLRFFEGQRKSYSLPFPKPRAPWCGLVGTTTHAFIWSSQAVLFTGAQGIEHVELDPPLDRTEEIRSAVAARRRLTLLRQGRDAAHIADFRGGKWTSSPPVILNDLVDFDGTAEDALLLARDGHLMHLGTDGAEHIRWDRGARQASDARGQHRPLYSVARFEHDVFLATDGGSLRLGQTGSVSFHACDNTVTDPAALKRLAIAGTTTLVEWCGPFIGRWNGRDFEAIDASQW